ncbi:hypothetical protein OJ997_07825 [Solirubrobacter phytolaccae]|uniref:Lipoprotein n=1 Tax=Solirubrobacter phytolaccae TaxID=1404360 RepID=A0A9X3S7F0_9ACTN|nr:hypothetical protein [Solirubrobacter phytolaccae]MDA0180198.1 hypothetical protein [Solirubrobacter phytolaccae]
MRTALLATLCALALPACGDGEQDEAAAAGEFQAVESALLAISDFPDGWTESDRSTGDDDTTCEGMALAEKRQRARSTAPRFQGELTSNVLTRVYRFEDEAVAGEVVDALGGAGNASCIGEDLGRAVADGEETVELGELSAKPLSVGDGLGDAAVATRVTMPLLSDAIDSQIILDFVSIRTGRAVAFVAFVQGVEPFDAALRKDLLARAAKRLGNANG